MRESERERERERPNRCEISPATCARKGLGKGNEGHNEGRNKREREGGVREGGRERERACVCVCLGVWSGEMSVCECMPRKQSGYCAANNLAEREKERERKGESS